jgi:hypothetical protein
MGSSHDSSGMTPLLFFLLAAYDRWYADAQFITVPYNQKHEDSKPAQSRRSNNLLLPLQQLTREKHIIIMELLQM